MSGTPEVAGRRRTGVARNTIIFSIATGLSRIMGLVREIVAARYFGTSGQASAFTIAFQVPNLVRGLFADAELGTLVSTIDKAVKRGALHRNTGARKKARAMRVRAGSPEA